MNDDNYNSTDNIIDILNNLSDADAKDYFDSLESDYWIEEYKNNF